MGVLLGVSEFIYKNKVTGVGYDFRMAQLTVNDELFSSFKRAIYAIYANFQMNFHVSGNIQEFNKYFSGKHELYG